ncbi:hypothetical protein [Thermobifida halotolerans]|uniref:hypothetical protein n=1 Tax=Thermobifida halotolerans TaxID=483545 RepID=UPI0008383FAA|nr:hypothetical protein [Thermobifida halotolerans]
MDTGLIIGLAVFLGLVVIAVAAVFAFREPRRGSHLKQRFGPEYDREVQRHGSRRRAEHELRERERRHSALDLRDLTPEERARYEEEWTRTQERFVDDPVTAVADADRLMSRVMADRGYPVDDSRQQAADLSVEHADVIDDYRRAHASAERGRSGEATTEELRDAMVRYRALFAELLGHTAHDEHSFGRHAVPQPRDTAEHGAAERDTAVDTGRRRW